MPTFGENTQWKRINSRIEALSDEDMGSFKRNKKVQVFPTWSPEKFGIYYLKTMLMVAADHLDEYDFALLDKVTNRNFGNPITITVKGRDLCSDYLQSLYEAKFIDNIGQRVERMIEIGAGYGRTCHTMLCLNPNIAEYLIIDLAPCLSLARKYLKHVLSSEQFTKVRFILNTECKDYLDNNKDIETLAINSNGLGEMDQDVSRSYLNLIAKNAHYFYSCNSVAKYDPTCVEERDFDPAIAKDALNSGLLTDRINIFDDGIVGTYIPPYLEVMKPAASWVPIRHKRGEIQVYTAHVLYASSADAR